MRNYIKNILTRQKYKTAEEVPAGELKRAAILFSPHPDDETLACGGTLIKKRQAGADVHVVYMTDGCRSHHHLMPETQLARTRMAEARMACHVLGLDASAPIFLEHHDGKLISQQSVAIHQVQRLVDRLRPEVIYTPYRLEPPLDHHATHQIVRQALMDLTWSGRIYEYPVWFWHHWPWVPLSRHSFTRTVLAIQQSLRMQTKFIWDFNCAVTISDVLSIKIKALAEYRSQMTRLVANQKWAILGDVAKGDFLKQFSQSKELFFTYDFRP